MLRDDTRVAWEERHEGPEDAASTYAQTTEALQAWISHNWQNWYEHPIAGAHTGPTIRDQALGLAYAANDLGRAGARYETYLDRKLERTLAMLIGCGSGVICLANPRKIRTPSRP